MRAFAEACVRACVRTYARVCVPVHFVLLNGFVALSCSTEQFKLSLYLSWTVDLIKCCNIC